MENRSNGHCRRPKPARQTAPRRPLWITLGILLIGLFGAGLAQAVTLGDIRVISYLNQPLEAEIALVGVEPGQHEDLRIRIANQDQFDRLGIAYTNFLADLRFDVIQTSGRWVVRVRSRQPVSEPFLDFPVQMTWPSGRIVRQYTLLLDPLTLSRPATVRRAAPTPPGPTPAAPSAPVASEPVSVPAVSYGGATYGPVRRGETLWLIAQKLKPRGITTRQMAMALFRANPQAFIDNNINKLRAGSILTIPPLGEIEQVDAATASRQFAEQVRQWRAPVATSPREVTVSAPPVAAPPSQVDSATQSEDVERPPEAPVQADTAATATEDDQLRIVTDKEEEATSGNQEALRQQLLVTMEEIESNRIVTSELADRLAKLEQELTNMQALVDLKDQQIAALRSEIAERDEPQKAAEPTQADAVPAPARPGEPEATQTPGLPETGVEAVKPEVPVTVEAAAAPATEPPQSPWFDQYRLLMYVLLGVLGTLAIIWVIRRQSAESSGSNVPLSDLPSGPPRPAYAGAPQPAREEMKQAERDFETMTHERVPEIQPDPVETAPLPEVGLAATKAVDEEIDGLTRSLLDEMLEAGKGLDQRPPSRQTADVSEDDIASWVEELGSELDQLDIGAAKPADATGERAKQATEEGPADDEIPSLLTALDDQMTTGSDTTARTPVANIELEPLDETPPMAEGPVSTDGSQEEDTFTMSLDLARAYLEIGDNDGASDMLRQALSSTSDPEQRRQIEELLEQIS